MPAAPARALHWPDWSPATWFIACGITANGLLTLVDYARGYPALWAAAPLLIGSGPNAVAVPAIAFTALGLALRPEFRSSVQRFTDWQLAVLAIVGAVTGLLCWEWVQVGAVHLRFDWRDVAATIASGVVCGGIAALVLRSPLRDDVDDDEDDTGR